MVCFWTRARCPLACAQARLPAWPWLRCKGAHNDTFLVRPGVVALGSMTASVVGLCTVAAATKADGQHDSVFEGPAGVIHVCAQWVVAQNGKAVAAAAPAADGKQGVRRKR
eukprot:353171-Chlamydomonas_euryale.AAC.7